MNELRRKESDCFAYLMEVCRRKDYGMRMQYMVGEDNFEVEIYDVFTREPIYFFKKTSLMTAAEIVT